MKFVYTPEPEPRMPPPTPVLVDLDTGLRALLDEGLRPETCYKEGVRVECPAGLFEGELLVTGWAAGEVSAGMLGARFVEERRARLVMQYTGDLYQDLARAAVDALSKPYMEEFIGGSMAVVVPAQLFREKATAVAIAFDATGGRPRLLARALLGEDGSPVSVADYRGLVERFGGFWRVPWEAVVSPGESLRRLVEFWSERPVEKLPSKLMEGVPSEDALASRVIGWAQSIEFEVYGRRESSRALVYIDGDVLGVEGYIAVLVQRNGYRKVRARWYYDEDFELRGFDKLPPDASPRLDVEICVGEVPRDCQVKLPKVLVRVLGELAPRSPVYPPDYVAVKVLRWYSVALF